MVECLKDKSYPPAVCIIDQWLARSLPPRRRTMLEFAQQEIIIPDGPFEGQHWKADAQPYARLLLQAIHNSPYRWNVITGCVQSGKTLAAFVIPCLYHLFEMGETVLLGVPSKQTVLDKWQQDLLPVIRASRFNSLMPTSGKGSKGGLVDGSITFGNGSTLRIMTGGGSDKSRASFTSRVLIVTETDGMDVAGAASRETNKLKQLEARTKAWGPQARIYMESTVSTEQGRTWQEYQKSTRGRFAMPCQLCHEYVTPEREHLQGWQDAADEIEAMEKAHYVCPSCARPWTLPQWRQSVRSAVLLFGEQTIDRTGLICGEVPRATTQGIRWNAAFNLFWTPADPALDEWNALRAKDPDDSERELRQFTWAIPTESTKEDDVELSVSAIIQRLGDWGRSELPQDTAHITAHLDLGKYECHYAVIAFREDGTPHVVEYDEITVRSRKLGTETALAEAMARFAQICADGWDGRPTDVATIDSGFWTQEAYRFAKENKRVICAKGFGESQKHTGPYHHPKKRDGEIKKLGQEYNLVHLRNEGVPLLRINADFWKSWLHERLVTPIEEPGAMTLFAADVADHTDFAKHLCAEKRVTEFKHLVGEVTRWEKVSRHNHFLDACYSACATGHFAGARLFAEPKRQVAVVASYPERREPEERGNRSSWKIGR